MRVAYCRATSEAWPAPGGPPAGWSVALLSDDAALAERLRESAADAVVLRLPRQKDQTQTLSRLRVAAPGAPIVVAASADQEEEAAATLGAGAADYWLEAMSPLRLRVTIEQAVLRGRLGAVSLVRDEALERVDDAVVVTDADERIVSWNRAAARLYGYPPEDVLGRLLPETLSPLWLDAETRLKAWRSVASRGVWLGETLHARHDGSPVRVAVELSAARDGLGRRAGLLLVARPAAAAEKAAPAPPAAGRDPRDAREFLGRILNGIADPVFVKDRDYRMIFVNDALCALVGRPREEILGRTDHEYLPKEQADVFRRQDDLVLRSGRENVNEEALTDAYGMSHILVTKKTVWRDAEGRPILVGVIRDVTDLAKAVDDLKRSQEQLRRAQKLEVVGRLAGGVAHDFNNVLTAIVGCANLVLEALPPGHEAREDAEEIRRAGERARDLTRQLLSFARRPEGMPQVLDLRELFGGMRRMLQRLLPAHLDLEFRVPDALSAVRIDPGQAEQVLLNLVVNAGDAMPEGGSVVVELSDAAQGGAGLTAPCVCLTVSDAGLGMDEPTRAAIFEPFFTTKPDGTGLGLATVRDVVARSGGAVAVESAPLRGSRFRVYWPRCEEKLPAARPGHRPSRGRKAPRRACVLVVEDDDAVRRFAVRSLERAGYEVLSAADGIEALRVSDAREGLLDVAVVDMILPRLLGPEFAARMRLRQPTAKVLFMSGYLGDPTVQSAAAKPSSFLPKPFDAPILADKVRALLATRA